MIASGHSLSLALLVGTALAGATIPAFFGLGRHPARGPRDGDRAWFLALSGVERASFELRRAPTTPGYPLPWHVYEERSTAPRPPVIDVARSPSFMMALEPAPKLLADNPRLPWPSGVLGGTHFTDPTN